MELRILILKRWKDILLSLGLLPIDWSKGLSKLKNSAGITSSVPDETMNIVGIPDSAHNSVLEETVCGVSKQNVIEIDKRNVQACYRLKKKKKKP